jgi:hypothetical protein
MAYYDIDLLRALMVNKLNDQSIFLASFYEQIQDEQQIERYVETIKELISLQNREQDSSGYKAMGIISQNGNADILNIRQNYIAPLEFNVRFDIEVNDRDYVLTKIRTLIDDLRGRKFDIIQLTNGSYVFPAMPTIDTTTDKMIVNQTNFLPQVNWTLFTPSTSIDPTNPTNDATLISDIVAKHVIPNTMNWTFYFIHNNKLWTRRITRTGESSFTLTTAVEVGTINAQYKLSLSFNGIQSQEPFINNGVDRVFLFFGGTATITDRNVALGNDIITTIIQVGKDTGAIHIVEPTELTGSLDVNDDTYPLWTTGYQSVDRNMAIANKVSYSFVFDRTIPLFLDLYKYGRYGSGASTYAQQIFTIKEYRYSFGTILVDKFYAKLGQVNTQNTNGDVMTISLLFKVGAY